jgi:hypothetical protein
MNAGAELPTLRSFDRGKPFYPIVLNYICQLIGLTEQTMRAVARPRDLDQMVRDDKASEQVVGIRESDPGVLRAWLQRTSNSQSLRCKMLDRDIGIPFDETAKELVTNYSYLAPYFIIAAAGSLFVMAHEITKGKPWRNNDPIWEFLFHCRNAIADNAEIQLSEGITPKYCPMGALRSGSNSAGHAVVQERRRHSFAG